MKHTIKTFFVALAALCVFAACDDNEKENKQNTTNTPEKPTYTSLPTSITHFYSESYPYNTFDTFIYDNKGRVIERRYVDGQGSEYETSGSYTYTYADNTITAKQSSGITTLYNLEGGRVVAQKTTYNGSVLDETKMVYDNEGHLVKEIHLEIDTVFYVWQEGNITRRFCHQHTTSNPYVGTYNASFSYVMGNKPFTACPITDYRTGDVALAPFGYFGTLPRNLIIGDTLTTTIEGMEISETNSYSYTFIDANRVSQISVESNTLPPQHEYKITWSE